jgi:murein DD-endopeptidase MepM/ murein hydrolase activator NlpD
MANWWDGKYAAALPPDGPVPSAAAVFPLTNKNAPSCVPYFLTEAQLKLRKNYTPGSAPAIGVPCSTANGRIIGYARCHGQGKKRFHCGIDLLAKAGEPIRACDAGTILRFKSFYASKNTSGPKTFDTYALFVEHDGYIINYGEVDKTSLKDFNLKVGDQVEPGQTIARVGWQPGAQMLHFELYTTGLKATWTSNYTPGNQQWLQTDASPPSCLLNPITYLLVLANRCDRHLYSDVLEDVLCR